MNEILESCKRSKIALDRNIKRLRRNISERNRQLADLEDSNCTVAAQDAQEYQRLDVANMEDCALLNLLMEIEK